MELTATVSDALEANSINRLKSPNKTTTRIHRLLAHENLLNVFAWMGN